MELVPIVILATILSGVVVGIFLGTFGGGGSVLAAPLLIYAVGADDPHVAIGTSAAAVAAISAVSLIGHWRAKRVKWPCAGMFALAGIAGSIAGSQLALRVDGTWLLLAFAVAMAAIGLSMFRKPKGLGDPDVHITAAIMARIVPLGLLTGLAAGFFGIGGRVPDRARPDDGDRDDAFQCNGFFVGLRGTVWSDGLCQLCPCRVCGPETGRATAGGRGRRRGSRCAGGQGPCRAGFAGPERLCRHDCRRGRLCRLERCAWNCRNLLTSRAFTIAAALRKVAKSAAKR